MATLTRERDRSTTESAPDDTASRVADDTDDAVSSTTTEPAPDTPQIATLTRTRDTPAATTTTTEPAPTDTAPATPQIATLTRTRDTPAATTTTTEPAPTDTAPAAQRVATHTSARGTFPADEGRAVDDLTALIERMARRIDAMAGIDGALAVLDDTIATLERTVVRTGARADAPDDAGPEVDAVGRTREAQGDPSGGTPPVSAATVQLLSSVLAEVMDVDEIAADSDFFDDLGADSMVMAHFCARLRKHPSLPPLSIKEVYHHPTVRRLSNSIADARASEPAPTPTTPVPPLDPAAPVSRWQHITFGAAQLTTMLVLAAFGAWVVARGVDWTTAADGLPATFARSAVFGGAVFVSWAIAGIVAKWLVIGRATPTHFRVWGLGHFRFWVGRLLVRSNPLRVFAGTPLFNWYLRALGADIGRGVLILSRAVPVHTDLLTVGDRTVVRKDAMFSCYRAQAGWIQTGPVTLGCDVVVGDTTVLDIYTSLGDGAQLGHSSTLHAGQSVPAGEHRQGTPALRRTDVDYASVEPTEHATRRRAVYSTMQVLILLSITLPLGLTIVALLARWRLSVTSPAGDGVLSASSVVRDALVVSIVLFVGLLVVGLVVVCTVPRLLATMVRPGEVYPLYGIRYWAHRAITRMTNVPFFTKLFGDSSYVVHYLYCLGYDVTFEEQTGANFGLNVKHDYPYCVTIGPGTMAADQLTIVNTEYSSTSFRVSPVRIGAHSFMGNFVAYPSDAAVGDDCLLASKVLVPVEGDDNEHLGFLGSPNFEIPRQVERDREFDDDKRGDRLGELLSAKNRHNRVTIYWFLVTRWFSTFVSLLVVLGAVDVLDRFGMWAVFVGSTSLVLFRSLFNVAVERASTGFTRLRPVYCSLYDHDNWRIERHWKLAWEPIIFNGTPFKSIFWRLLGVRMGKRVFDDGCVMTEKTMITVGDDCVLNAGSVIQTHSQEDGAFKSDRITVGDGCTLGVRSLVHYGATMGDRSSIDANAFLMKGAEVAPGSHWAENPAREVFGGPVSREHRAEEVVDGRPEEVPPEPADPAHDEPPARVTTAPPAAGPEPAGTAGGIATMTRTRTRTAQAEVAR